MPHTTQPLFTSGFPLQAVETQAGRGRSQDRVGPAEIKWASHPPAGLSHRGAQAKQQDWSFPSYPSQSRANSWRFDAPDQIRTSPQASPGEEEVGITVWS
jgi:hypothetical protein